MVVGGKTMEKDKITKWLGVRDMVVSDILNNNIDNRFEYTFERI